jgi:hypothetical protein
MKPLAHGIYEALIDEYLRDALVLRPELRTVLGKTDSEEHPAGGACRPRQGTGDADKSRYINSRKYIAFLFGQ